MSPNDDREDRLRKNIFRLNLMITAMFLMVAGLTLWIMFATAL